MVDEILRDATSAEEGLVDASLSGTEIFRSAVDWLRESTDRRLFGPRSFQQYVEATGGSAKTAPSISVDSFERLPQFLKHHEVMVFRLGASPQGNTQFVLAKMTGRLRELFLFDHEIYSDRAGATFLSNVSMRRLFAYQLLPALSEGALVNLAAASGILSEALGFSDKVSLLPPATGHSTFTFSFSPHSTCQERLIHNRGQIEIDALWIERRGGKDSLFIVEAKAGEKEHSLAKHKLVYPILALAPHLPRDMPIIPVYLRAYRSIDGIHFHVVECEFPDPRDGNRAIDELNSKTHSHFVLPLGSKQDIRA